MELGEEGSGRREEEEGLLWLMTQGESCSGGPAPPAYATDQQCYFNFDTHVPWLAGCPSSENTTYNQALSYERD